MTNNRHNGIFYGVDGWTVLLYVLIVAAGWISITSASYDDSAADLLSFSHFYMKQLMWIGMAWVTAIIVLLLDERFYHMFAYPAYLGGIALLVAALLFGREVNGAKAWFEFGSLRVQPVEFAKIATALALARVMSEYSFSINRAGDLMKVAVVICIPLFIIILQNDTGSGIVLGSFLFVLYREGLNKWLCIPVLLIAALFIVSFLLSPMTLLVTLILVCTLSEAMMNVAFAPRVPGRGDAVGHPAMPRDGADRPRNARSLPQPAHNDPRGRGLRCRIRLPLESRQHLHHAGTVRRFARLPAHHRLHLQFDSQTAPARPYIKLPGHHQRPARNRLQRQPGENRHRLGQLLGQGLPRRDPDQIRVRPRKAHRLHLLHRGRGVGIPRLGRGADAAVPADPAADAHGSRSDASTATAWRRSCCSTCWSTWA